MSELNDRRWRFDKTLNVSVIIACVIQTFVFVIAATNYHANTENRLANLEKEGMVLQTHEVRIIKVETKLDSVLADTSEIKNLIRNKR